jgi:hypothetical protein
MDVRKSKAVDAERGEQDATIVSLLWTYLMADVDPAQSTGPLTAFCFMTGYMCVHFQSSYPKLPPTPLPKIRDAISFSAIFVWCGFQTGNFIQVN